ncbi:peptidylprolyl isomerase [Betaproteobacteria bacterium]|nr:peptidylprolyl isomerase [Betaproteobacteria bacterium]GHU43890.1 peptidylprolyl isomerase [Betaproteobacteria bacterium]
MSSLKKISAALIASALISAPAFAADPVFVTVNGKAISQTTANLFIKEQTAQGAQDTPELRAAIKDELIRRELIVSEARKTGLDKKPEIKAQLESAQQIVLMRAYFGAYLQKNPATDAEINEVYNSFKTRLGDTEYHVRHILVATEDEAKAIITKLDNGGKFEELAKDSQDPGSSENGGDLGWMAPSAFVAPFAEALTKQGKGTYTKEPVQSQYGYHVILVEDSRALTPPPLEDVKNQIVQSLEQQKVEKLLTDLRSKAKIK